jgi:malate dehydrogenase (oxaloacetate-decarboxylating)
MFQAASRAISEMVTPEQLQNGELLPPLTDIRKVSFQVALAVAKQAREEGIGMRVTDDRLASLIYAAMWEPHYYPYRYHNSK